MLCSRKISKLEISWRWFEGGFKTTVWLLGWCINKRGDVNLAPLSTSLLSKKRSRQYIICWDAYQKTYYFYVVQVQQHINKNISNWLNSERMVNTFSFILSVQCSAPNRDKKEHTKRILAYEQWCNIIWPGCMCEHKVTCAGVVMMESSFLAISLVHTWCSVTVVEKRKGKAH